MYAIPLLFFLYKSTQARLEGNWAFVCFVSFWPLANEWFQSVRTSRTWRWLTAAGFLPPAILVSLLIVHLFFPFPFVPPKIDRLHRQFAIEAATREVSKQLRERGEPFPVFTTSYQWTAWLRFQSLPAQQIACETRPSHFTRPPHPMTNFDRVYVVSDLPISDECAAGFGPPELITSVPLKVRGEVNGALNIRLYSKASPKSSQEVPDQ